MSGAKYAFVLAEMPAYPSVDDPSRTWQGFLESLRTRQHLSETIKSIPGSAWLIPLNTGMPFLVFLFDQAKGYKIPLNILFLDEPPDWIRYPPDGK